MARLIPAAERIVKARALIQKARDLPVPEEGRLDLTYLAQVKGCLREARDLVKFISYSPSADAAMKKDVASILKEADEAEKEIMH